MRCQDWIQQEEWKKQNPPRKGFAALEGRDGSAGSVPAEEESQVRSVHSDCGLGVESRCVSVKSLQLAHPYPGRSHTEVNAPETKSSPVPNVRIHDSVMVVPC